MDESTEVAKRASENVTHINTTPYDAWTDDHILCFDADVTINNSMTKISFMWSGEDLYADAKYFNICDEAKNEMRPRLQEKFEEIIEEYNECIKYGEDIPDNVAAVMKLIS